MHQAYIRIAGHGLRLLPQAPFALTRSDDAALELTGLVDERELTTRVTADTELPRALGELSGGPDGDWLLEVGGVYVAAWPCALAVVSAPEPDRPPFYMLADGAGGLVYVQGPMPRANIPDRDTMRAEGQRETARGDAPGPWIELAYEHDGERWLQRHISRPFGDEHGIVITTQALADSADAIHRAAAELAQSIAHYRAQE